MTCGWRNEGLDPDDEDHLVAFWEEFCSTSEVVLKIVACTPEYSEYWSSPSMRRTQLTCKSRNTWYSLTIYLSNSSDDSVQEKVTKD